MSFFFFLAGGTCRKGARKHTGKLFFQILTPEMKFDIVSNALKASNGRLGIQYTWGCVHGILET